MVILRKGLSHSQGRLKIKLNKSQAPFSSGFVFLDQPIYPETDNKLYIIVLFTIRQNIIFLERFQSTLSILNKYQPKKLSLSAVHLSHGFYDKFNMSYSQSQVLPPPPYGRLENFMPLNPQFSQMFNFPSHLNRIPPVPGPLFPANFFIQQQKNYYNSILASSSLLVPLNSAPTIIPHRKVYTHCSVQSLAAKNVTVCSKKSNINPEIICLDDEASDNVIVIEDSSEAELQPVKVKKVEKVQEEIVKTDFKIQDQKKAKQKPACESSKIKEDLPPKRHNRAQKHPVQPHKDHKALRKKAKKKGILKQKYAYRLNSHEKHLSQLEQLRAFFPHETATGPQFQAHISSLQLFRRKFVPIKVTAPGCRSGNKIYQGAYKGSNSYDIIILQLNLDFNMQIKVISTSTL